MSLVDVIITCYNKEKQIRRAIESVKAQTFIDYRAWVIDDGSTDNSRNVILDAIKDDDRFVYIRIKNAGVANARNTAISYGNAPFITCLDGDDGIQTAFLETLYNAISQDKTMGIAYTDVLLFHGDGNFEVARWPDTNHNEQFNGHNQVPCCNMFRRDVFERLGGYRQRYSPRGAGAEDAEMWLRFFRAGYKAVKVSKEPLFVYSMFTGLTQQGDYKEVNWLAWHNQTPFTSLQKPANNIMHPVYEYDQPEISVIIPVGPGHSHFLVDALDSLEAQTFRNWEAIVVWDGYDMHYENGKWHTDNKAIKQIQKAYPYVKFCYMGNAPSGAGKARNGGAEYARGDYLVFLDADDYLQSRFLELTYSAMQKFKPSWVYTDIYEQYVKNEADYNAHVSRITTEHEKIVTHKDGLIEYYWHEPLKDDIDHLWREGIAPVTCLYNKEDFWEVGGFNETDNREDWELHLQLAQAGKCWLHIPLPLMTYRLHAGFRREYMHTTDDRKEQKRLKRSDVERIHEKYKLEDLRMACGGKCKKKRVVPNLPEAATGDTKVMEFNGPKRTQSGTVYVGKATGAKYVVAKYKGKLCIFNVHPSDAAINPIAALFKPLSKPKRQKPILVAVTPKPVVVEEMKPKVEPVKKIEPVEDFVPTEEYIESTNTPMWYESPEDYTIAKLKKEIKRRKPELWQIETMLENERMGLNRKGAVAYLKGLLK